MHPSSTKTFLSIRDTSRQRNYHLARTHCFTNTLQYKCTNLTCSRFPREDDDLCDVYVPIHAGTLPGPECRLSMCFTPVTFHIAGPWRRSLFTRPFSPRTGRGGGRTDGTARGHGVSDMRASRAASRTGLSVFGPVMRDKAKAKGKLRERKQPCRAGNEPLLYADRRPSLRSKVVSVYHWSLDNSSVLL